LVQALVRFLVKNAFAIWQSFTWRGSESGNVRAISGVREKARLSGFGGAARTVI
jgi:hypothetical protein